MHWIWPLGFDCHILPVLVFSVWPAKHSECRRAVFGTVAAPAVTFNDLRAPVSKMDECINFCRIRWAEVICVSVIAQAQWCQHR